MIEQGNYPWPSWLGGPGMPGGWGFGGNQRPGMEVGGEGSSFHRPFAKRGFWQREPATAGEIMTTPVRAVMRKSPLAEIARIMREENVGIVPVVNEERRLVGVVTDRDIVVRALAQGRADGNVLAEEIMTPDVEAVVSEEPVTEVINLMARRRVQRVPVVDRGDRLLGIVSMEDVANRADRSHELQEALHRIAARRSFWANL